MKPLLLKIEEELAKLELVVDETTPEAFVTIQTRLYRMYGELETMLHQEKGR